MSQTSCWRHQTCKNTQTQSEIPETRPVWPFAAAHEPFLVIRRYQAFLWAPDGENTGLRGVDYCREVLNAKHPQIRDRESASLDFKKKKKEKKIRTSWTNTRPEDQVTCCTWNSCGCSLPSLALLARAETSELMAESPLVWALNTMGVIRPLAVLTATLTSTTWFLRRGENRVNAGVRTGTWEMLPPNGKI